MIHRKVAKHLTPHYLVEDDLLEVYPEPHRFHHRAHGLSLGSLFVYFQGLLIFTASLYFVSLKAPEILGTLTFGADQIVSFTNERRVQNGLNALSYNPLLAQAAQAKAQDMLLNNYWAHNSPTGTTPWSFINASGYKYVYAGENLARDFNDPVSVVNAWMNSPSHRANLLDRNFKEIGVAVLSGNLTGKEGILVVQMFGAGVSQAQQPQPVAEATGAEVEEAVEEVALLETEEVAQVPQAVLVESNISSPVSEATVLASRKFSVAKGVSLVLVGFIFTLFVLEVLISLRREKAKLKTGVFAHLGILAFVLFAVWYAAAGAIL